MDNPPDREHYLDAFEDWCRDDRAHAKSTAHNCRVAADQLLEYLSNLSPDHDWRKLLNDRRLVEEFIGRKGTSPEKIKAIREFVVFARTSGGKWASLMTSIDRITRHPRVRLFSFIAVIALGMLAVLTYIGFAPGQALPPVFRTPTPTITNTLPPSPTLTLTLTPTPTLTATSTSTPTPNPTQILLATLTPTSAIAFVPTTRIGPDGSKQVWVPAGSYLAGDHSGLGDPDEVVHQVYTDGFWLDQYLITNQQFAACPVNICGQPNIFTSHKRPSGYYGIPQYADYPVIEITWPQAEAFCQWKGGRLPTEAEWEKAAGWDPRTSQMRIYPWGDQLPHTAADSTSTPLANYNNVDLDTTKVGTYPLGVSAVDAYDMAGNVWEWMLDWYGNYDLRNGINPMGPLDGKYKVIRGGSWANTTSPSYLRVSNRGYSDPNRPTNEIGFRCAFTQ